MAPTKLSNTKSKRNYSEQAKVELSQALKLGDVLVVFHGKERPGKKMITVKLWRGHRIRIVAVSGPGEGSQSPGSRKRGG